MKAVGKFVPMVVLLLVLTLLLGPTAAAGRPPKIEAKDVVFSGDIDGQGDLIVEIQRTGVTVYGPTLGWLPLTFVNDDDTSWEGFEGAHTGKIRITLKNGDATVYFGFESYYSEVVKAWVPLYQLEEFGTYNADEDTYHITLEETTVYDVEIRRTGKSGGYGLEYTKAIDVAGVGFDMTIGE